MDGNSNLSAIQARYGLSPHNVVHQNVGVPLHPYEGETSHTSYQNANRKSTSFFFASNQLHPHHVMNISLETLPSSYGERQSSMGENPFHPVPSSLGMTRNPLHPTGDDE
jgi:hypothetical protein